MFTSIFLLTPPCSFVSGRLCLSSTKGKVSRSGLPDFPSLSKTLIVLGTEVVTSTLLDTGTFFLVPETGTDPWLLQSSFFIGLEKDKGSCKRITTEGNRLSLIFDLSFPRVTTSEPLVRVDSVPYPTFFTLLRVVLRNVSSSHVFR